MRIIGIVESDDYSGAAIIDSDYISVVQMNGYWMAASKCMFSHMPVTCEISEEEADKFIENGVKYLNFDGDTKPKKESKKRK
jgi:hypothetical protein